MKTSFSVMYAYIHASGLMPIETIISNNCEEMELDLSLNITNIVGLGNMLSFKKIKQCHNFIWALGPKYYYEQQTKGYAHARNYKSAITVHVQSIFLCRNSSFTIHFHQHFRTEPGNIPGKIKTLSKSKALVYQIPYHERIHIFSHPKIELINKNLHDIFNLCRQAGSSPFYYFTEKELTYVLDWLTYHGTKGAPVFIFTSLTRIRVFMHVY